MAQKSREQVCSELEALNQSLKNPIEFATDEEYKDLVGKLKQAEAQFAAQNEPEPKAETKVEPKPKAAQEPIPQVHLSMGNDEYGTAINELFRKVAQLKAMIDALK